MSNIDKQAQKELYAKVEQQAHSLRGNPREYLAATGMCPVNVIEMHAQKIQALLDELEAAKSYAKERDEENQDLMLTVGRLRVEREHLQKTSEARRAAILRTHKMFQKQRDRAATAEKRAAELEAQRAVVTLPAGYSVRPGHPINEAERSVMIPKDGGQWLSRFDVEHALRVAGIRINGEG